MQTFESVVRGRSWGLSAAAKLSAVLLILAGPLAWGQTQTCESPGNLVVDGTLSVGTATPAATFEVDSTLSPSVIFKTFANAASLGLYRANGSASAPTASVAGDILGVLNFRGYGATGFASGRRAGMLAYAAENWSDTNQGTYLTFETTPTGSTTPSERLRIDSAGNVAIGTATPSAKLDVNGTVRGGTVTATGQFMGPGTGLTGTASGLSIGGSAATLGGYQVTSLVGGVANTDGTVAIATSTPAGAPKSVTLSVPPNKTNQQVQILNNGAAVGTRKALNLIPGTGVTLTVADNATADRVDITVSGTSTSGAGMKFARFLSATCSYEQFAGQSYSTVQSTSFSAYLPAGATIRKASLAWIGTFFNTSSGSVSLYNSGCGASFSRTGGSSSGYGVPVVTLPASGGSAEETLVIEDVSAILATGAQTYTASLILRTNASMTWMSLQGHWELLVEFE